MFPRPPVRVYVAEILGLRCRGGVCVACELRCGIPQTPMKRFEDHQSGRIRDVGVLIVDLSNRFGGSNARVLGLMQGFEGARLALGALAGSPLAVEARELGLKAHTVAAQKTDPGTWRRLRRLVCREGYQVLDVQNPQSKFWAALVAACEGTALVSTLNGWSAAEYGLSLKGRLYQAMELMTADRTDMFIAVSKKIRDKIVQEGVPQEAVALIPNAVDMLQDSVKSDAQWLRSKFGFPDCAVLCVAVGRLVWAKGYDHLIRAIGLSRHENVCCAMIGQGDREGELRRLIQKEALGERIRLGGFYPHDETLKAIKSADMFVMASLSEGTPIALLEAAMLARPIVATRAGGIPEMVKHNQHALLVEPGNEAELANAIDYLVEHPDRCRSLGREAQKHVAANFSREAQQNATRAAYLKALQRKRTL